MFDLVVATVPWGFFILAAAICSLLPWILGIRRTVKKHKEGGRGRGSKYYSSVPRPATPPIIAAQVGSLEVLRAAKEGTLPWMFEQIAQDSGNDVFYVKPMKMYIVGDAEVARKIILDDLSVKSKHYEILNVIAGNRNLLTSVKNDNIWHTTRKAINRSFSTVETKRMNDIALMQISKWIDEKLEPAIANNAAIDPSLEMTRITFKVITEAAFEYKATDKEFELFVHHSEVALKHVMAPIAIVSFWKYIGPLFSSYREGMRSSAEIQAFGKRILDSYRENPNKSSNNTVIKVLATPGICTDEAHMVAEILASLVGGFDSTGHTLASTLMLLAKHPNVQDKLRSEILATNDIDERSKCNYMKDVITESNRLIPVSGLGAVRTTGRDFFCKNRSMMIPKGSDVKLCQTLHNRNPTVFTNPKAFEPERWENPTKEMQQSVMMFLCGLRRCPGQSLAMAELHSAIPKLIAEYQVDVESEGKILNFLTMGYVGARLNFTKISS